MKPYYDHAGIQIYHGDCRDVLPHVSADVLVTDPPYGVGLGKHKAASETRPGYLVKGSYESYDDTRENLSAIVVPAVIAALSVMPQPRRRCRPSRVAEYQVKRLRRIG